MKINSRFAKTTVAAALVVASGAATLGITSFVSAEIQDPENPAVVVDEGGAVGVTSDTPVADGSVVSDGSVSASAAPTDDSNETTIVRRNSPISVAATALGMTEADLVTELQAGKSIADVAATKNVDLDTVIDALYADLKTHIDAHVAEGKLTREQADTKLADAKTRITTMVNTAGPLRGKGMGGHKGGHEGRGHGAPKFATEDLAKVLGLSLDELNTEMQTGKTLAQIAEAQNVSIDKVKDQLLADFTAKEQAEVAEGKHTQEEVDAKIAEFTARLDDMVNGVRPQKGMGGMGDHGGRRGPGGHGGRHGGGMGQFGPGAPADGAITEGAAFSA